MRASGWGGILSPRNNARSDVNFAQIGPELSFAVPLDGVIDFFVSRLTHVEGFNIEALVGAEICFLNFKRTLTPSRRSDFN